MKKIGCAGILVADLFCGPIPALPSEGALLAVGPMPSMAGGCAANVAVDLVKQGLSADVAGCVGEDAGAEMIRRYLGERGVGVSGLSSAKDWPTSQTVILLIEGQDRRYLHNFGANSAFTAQALPKSWLDSLDLFYVGGMYAMPGFSSAQLAETLRYCRQRGITTVVDVVISESSPPGSDWVEWLPYADWFLPNDDEGKLLTGATDPEAQLEAFARLGANGVLVTLGEKGLLAMTKGKCWRAAAHRSDKSIDPSGAGDAFTAGWIAGMASGQDIPGRIAYGAALGMSATLAIGTTAGVFTAEEATTFMESHKLDIREI